MFLCTWRSRGFWWNNQWLAKLGAKTVASPYEEIQRETWMERQKMGNTVNEHGKVYRLQSGFFFPPLSQKGDAGKNCLWDIYRNDFYLHAPPAAVFLYCTCKSQRVTVLHGWDRSSGCWMVVIDCFLASLPTTCNGKLLEKDGGVLSDTLNCS